MMRIFHRSILLFTSILLLLLQGCGVDKEIYQEENVVESGLPELTAVPLDVNEKLKVVATTSIVADVVSQVAGNDIILTTLIPLGMDPHTFEPTPQDIVIVADAHVIFSNGLGLEGFLDRLIDNAGKHSSLIPVSYGVQPLEGIHHEDEQPASGDESHEDTDPHVWFDPNNVIVWTQTINSSLQTLDPANAAAYEQRAEAYQTELMNLDSWITEQITQIAEPNRKLVTDHLVFNYFAERYGFEQIGTILPGYNASAQPSARELADLTRNIETYAVKSIFVGKTVNLELINQVAEDLGLQLVYLYTGSLSERDGVAGNYIDFMRYNTLAIVNSLK